MEHLAWPSVVLIICIIAIFVFRQPLTRLLDRAKKISKDGIEANLNDQQASLTTKSSTSETLLKVFENQLLLNREKYIKELLDNEQVKDQGEREKVLTRYLAQMFISYEFEKTYRLIWGSQVEALQFLNTQGFTGVLISEIQAIYQEAGEKYPNFYEDYSFDAWMAFLLNNSLMTLKEDKAIISLEGHEFLKYLVHQGYSPYKYG